MRKPLLCKKKKSKSNPAEMLRQDLRELWISAYGKTEATL